MTQSRKRVLIGAALGLALTAGAAHAGGGIAKTYAFDGAFEDAAFGVESAIVDKGLVIDYVSHTGDMLNRTGKDVGSTKPLFEKADIYLFCSAVLSRKVMEADPANIAYCPYKVFVTKREGKVEIGHPVYPAGPMKEVEALLADIANQAIKD
ncbi:MAG: DUF302 domain-containing protein [Cohaesibacter sp.]|nr:DUF302 domain-containing protein [Cohaesibacter sp.]